MEAVVDAPVNPRPRTRSSLAKRRRTTSPRGWCEICGRYWADAVSGYVPEVAQQMRTMNRCFWHIDPDDERYQMFLPRERRDMLVQDPMI